jgi:ribosomal protein L40E
MTESIENNDICARCGDEDEDSPFYGICLECLAREMQS